MAGYTTFINHLGEKDDFFDIYKKEPREMTEQEKDVQFASDMESLESHTKGTDDKKDVSSMTDEELDEYSNNLFSDVDYLENNWYDVQKESRLCFPNTDNSGYVRKMKTARLNYNKAVKEVYNRVKNGSAYHWNQWVNGDVVSIIKAESNKVRAEKAKATAVSNQDKRLKKYINELKVRISNNEVPQDVIDLLDDEGKFKERNSWGVIKKYFNANGSEEYSYTDKMSELGKTLKNLWKNEFV